MADFEKQVSLIEVDVDVTQAKKDVDDLTSSILAQKDAVKSNSDEIKQLEKANKDLQKEVKDGNKTQQEANKEIAENQKRAFELKKVNENLKDGIKDLNKQRQAAVKATKLQSNSLDALRKKSADLKKELNAQETATESGTAAFVKLQKELEETNDKIRELDQGAGDFKTSVGNYPKALNTAKTAVIGLGGALKALGLGLIVAAVAKFTEALQENQRVADFLAKVTKTLGIAFNDLVNFILDSAGEVADFFKSIFDDPLGSLESLGQAIKDNLVERFNSLIEVLGLAGKAMKQVFEGDFSGALETAKEAGKELVDVYTGIPNSVDRATDAITKGASAIADYAVETYNAADALVEMEKQQQLNEVQQQRLIQQNERLAEQQRQIRDNDQNTIEDRIAANEKLFKILDEQERLEKAQLQTAIDSAKQRLALDATNVEAQIALQEALLATEDVENRIEGQRSEALANRVALEKERQEEAEEATAERRELEKEALARHLEELQTVRDEAAKKQEQAEKDKAKVISDIQQKSANVASSITQTANNIVERAYQNRFANLEKQFKSGAITEEEYARKKEILEKNQAIKQWKVERAAFIAEQVARSGQAIQSTAQSIAASVAAFPLTAGQPFASINAALGGIQLATILSTPPPQRPTFAEGGIVVSGKSHAQGGESIHVGGRYVGEMEGGEGLFVTKQAATMAMLNDYNTSAGGRSLFSNSQRFLQEGGSVNTASSGATAEEIAAAMADMPAPVVQVQSVMAGINAEVEAKEVGTI